MLFVLSDGKLQEDNSQNRGFVVPDSSNEAKGFIKLLPEFNEAHQTCCNGSRKLIKGTGELVSCNKEYSDPTTRDCCKFYQAADFGEDDGCAPSKAFSSILRISCCRHILLYRLNFH